MSDSDTKIPGVFDYRTLRLLVGLVAFLLPVFAWINSSPQVPSISASYYTENRDTFVGLTFVIGALFWAYNGHNTLEKWVSKVASVAAIVTAIFPTACEGCATDLTSTIHYTAAVILFVSIAYFCLCAFREGASNKDGPEAKRREVIYLGCGLIIVASLLVAAIAQFAMDDVTRKELALTFWVEWASLWAFALAWIVAGKVIPLLVKKEDMLRFSLK